MRILFPPTIKSSSMTCRSVIPCLLCSRLRKFESCCLIQVDGYNGRGDQWDPEPTRFATKQIGNSAVAVGPDGRVVAVGGWDGRWGSPEVEAVSRGEMLIDLCLIVSVYTRRRPSSRWGPWLTIVKRATPSLSRTCHGLHS